MSHRKKEMEVAPATKKVPPRLSLINLQKVSTPVNPKTARLNREKMKVDLLKTQLKNAKISSSIITPSLEFRTIQHRVAKPRSQRK